MGTVRRDVGAVVWVEGFGWVVVEGGSSRGYR